MSSQPSAIIEHIFTPYDMLEKYGKDSFSIYLEKNQFEVQSRKTMSSGKERPYSYKELANIWEPIFEGLMVDSHINLGQMIRNYHSPKNTQTQKDDIVKALFQIAMHANHHGELVKQEVIMFGMGMMFADTLDWSDANSIVHLTAQNIEAVLEPKDTVVAK